MAVNVGMSAKTAASKAESTAAKASSVGAKTVKGPSPLRVPARSAAMTAASRVSWSGLSTMMSTTVPRGGGGGAGNKTASMTWTTPLSATRSVTVMRALFTYAPESVNEMVNSSPFKVGTIIWSIKSASKTFPPWTWRVKMDVNVSMSAKTAASVAESMAAKASSVGANTVKGPSPLKVPARSAAKTASSNVSWSSLSTMMSTTVVGGGGGSVGTRTASITCTTPLSAGMSAKVTIALLMNVAESVSVTVNSWPFSVDTIIWSIRPAAKASPPCT